MQQSSIRILLLSLFILTGFASCEIIEEDDYPDSDLTDPFLGTWKCTESEARSYQFVYQVEIMKDPSNSSRVLLDNFGFIGFNEKPPYGVVAGSTITIPQQEVCDDNSITVSGFGILIDANTMNWEYQLVIGGDKNDYTALFEK
ncbi:MAG: hypothetical protein KAG99_05360 [Bacteroidales bacterium]|nr:hypothetical protein [Bacteroidales bacterium]